MFIDGEAGKVVDFDGVGCVWGIVNSSESGHFLTAKSRGSDCKRMRKRNERKEK